MSRPNLLPSFCGLFFFTTLLLSTNTVAHAQVCHDNIWQAGEYCGYDANVVTGEVDMNHDCVVDFLDAALFWPQIGMVGPNISADINGDNVVNIADVAALAASLFSGNAVTPCTPVPTPDLCGANLSLSFDPGIIVSRTRAPMFTTVTVYVVATGWVNATALEFGIEHSSNVVVTNATSPPGWSQGLSDTNGNQKWYTWHNPGAPASGTTAVVAVEVLLLDTNPATVKLIDYDPSLNQLNRWSNSSLTSRTEFQVRRNLGINSIDSISTTACPNPNSSPTVAITNPGSDIVVPGSGSPYPLAGTALDTDGTLSFVEYRVNAGAWVLASGTTNWAASVPLIVGENWIQVRSADTLGGYSSTQVVTITRLDAPDLTITQWTAPASLVTGCEELNFTATCANIASGAAAGPSRLGFYLSTDPTIDTGDFLIGSVALAVIPANQDITVSPTFSIPDSGPRGEIYFGVLADDLNDVAEGDENNNDASSAFDFPVPAITSIVDVRNDQGRSVRINALASSRDVSASSTPILQYEVFRRIDALPKWAASAKPLLSGKQLSSLAKQTGWEFAGAVPAHIETEYNMIMPTLADSTDLGIHQSVFFIRAATDDPGVFFDSCPDSGYSVDNLPPSIPKNMAVAYGAAGNQLSWDPSLDEDFRYFRIYRGTDALFVPDDNNLVASLTETEWLDTEPDPWNHSYRVSTVDLAGNESETTSPLVVTGTQDLPSTPVKYALHQCAPNPFNPRTLISYDLPADAQVVLNVYASNGRLVTTLVSEQMPAGTHEVTWNGKDRYGQQVATGLYFYRLEADAFEQTRRMVLLK